MIVSDFRAPLATRSTYERSTPNRVRPLLTPAIFTLSQGVYFWHRARSEERRVGTEGSERRMRYQAEDGIRDWSVTGVQTCALPISSDVSRLNPAQFLQQRTHDCVRFPRSARHTIHI